jgi:hypothetical protein
MSDDDKKQMKKMRKYIKKSMKIMKRMKKIKSRKTKSKKDSKVENTPTKSEDLKISTTSSNPNTQRIHHNNSSLKDSINVPTNKNLLSKPPSPPSLPSPSSQPKSFPKTRKLPVELDNYMKELTFTVRKEGTFSASPM